MASSTSGIDFVLTEDGDMDATIYQGLDIYFTLQRVDAAGEPIDVTGYDVVMQLRSMANSNEVVGEFSVANGCVTVGGVDGIIEFEMDDAQSLLLTAGEGVYDIRALTPQGQKWQPQSGKYKIIRAITRP